MLTTRGDCTCRVSADSDRIWLLDADEVLALEVQDRTRLVRRRDRQAESLDDLADQADLLLIGGELVAALPQRVFESHAHVSAHRRRHRRDAHLTASSA